jgi:hypothetical protein
LKADAVEMQENPKRSPQMQKNGGKNEMKMQKMKFERMTDIRDLMTVLLATWRERESAKRCDIWFWQTCQKRP